MTFDVERLRQPARIAWASADNENYTCGVSIAVAEAAAGEIDRLRSQEATRASADPWFTRADEREKELLQAREKNAALRSAIEDLEWTGLDDARRVTCPQCHGRMPTHQGGCVIGQALGRAC